MCVLSVRCRPLVFSKPLALNASSILSSRKSSGLPLTRRDRNSRCAPARAGSSRAVGCEEDRVVKAGVGQFQAQRVLPVDAGQDGMNGLTVGEILEELEDGDHQGAMAGWPVVEKRVAKSWSV